MEDNLLTIATVIYSDIVRPCRFYDLQFEETGNIQEILCVITLHGIRILYGHYDPKLLTLGQQNDIIMYVRSYGFDVLFENGKYKFELLK
jgi:hypothetical protein